MFRTRDESSDDARASLFELLLAMSATATIALIFGLTIGLSQQVSLMLLAGAVILTGGIVFSFVEMHRLGMRNDREQRRRTAQIQAQMEALTLQAARRAKAERDVIEPMAGNEPYRHHEDHSESPGYDQGQLTSWLSGTTPFL